MSNVRLGVVAELWDGNDLLTGYRCGNKTEAGTWACPGGAVEPNETVEEAAARETLEETGIKVNPADGLIYDCISTCIANVHWVTVVVRFNCKKTEPTCTEPDKFDNLAWRNYAKLVNDKTQVPFTPVRLAWERRYKQPYNEITVPV